MELIEFCKEYFEVKYVLLLGRIGDNVYMLYIPEKDIFVKGSLLPDTPIEETLLIYRLDETEKVENAEE